MAIKLVPLPKELKTPLPDNLKRARKIGLYRGNFARVEIWTSKKKPLCLCRNVNGKTVRTFYGLDEITLANDTARRYEIQGRANGQTFGTISNDEKTALMKWRDYAFAEVKAGRPAPSLAAVIGNLIEHEKNKDKTPSFPEAAAQFIEAKHRAQNCSYEYIERITRQLNTLSQALSNITLAEITEETLLSAILATAKPRSGKLSPKTLKHYIGIAKEMFKWFYTRENSTRAAHEKLNNPLDLMEAPTTRARDQKDPETLSPSQTAELLNNLIDTAPEAVPAVVFQLFCGIRNAEALRIRWRDIRENTLYLSRAITKTATARAVPIPENARAWINACRDRGISTNPNELVFPGKATDETELANLDATQRDRIEAENFRSRKSSYTVKMNKLTARLPFAKAKNVFRHTGVSALAAIHGNHLAADFCGHSEAIAGKHYRNPFSLQDAQAYFGIMPQ